MASFIRSLLLLNLCVLSATKPHGQLRQDTNPILWARVPKTYTRSNNSQGIFNETASDSRFCKFDQPYVLQAIEANCSTYISPVELSDTALPWERWGSGDRLSNCTYHQIFSRFPGAPNGFLNLAFDSGQFKFVYKPNGVDALQYGPLPPLDSTITTGDKPAEFLAIFKDATQSFFKGLKLEMPCSAPNAFGGNASPGNSSGHIPADANLPSKESMGLVYQAIDIAIHQYTRCVLQNPAGVRDCTVKTTQKLQWLPGSFFIFSGASSCDSKLWSFIGVGGSILLDFIQIGAMMWFKGTGGFSWLLFLVKLASGLGEPIIQAIILQRASFVGTSAFIIAAMEFLQPTAAPLVAALAGWYFSKGQAFQVLATDAVTTMMGVVMIMATTLVQMGASLAILQTDGVVIPPDLSLVPIGLGLAVGPWLLVYILLGCITMPLQICFLLGIIEAWILETHCLLGVAMLAFFILVIVLSFVGLTPIWALWELGWTIRQKVRNRNEMKGVLTKRVDEGRPIFPLARFMQQKFRDTSRWKRGLIKFVFWLFVLLSLASFVGKWMFMVNSLGFAGDAYCPSNYKEATFAGLGYKAFVLLSGFALQFAGLTL